MSLFQYCILEKVLIKLSKLKYIKNQKLEKIIENIAVLKYNINPKLNRLKIGIKFIINKNLYIDIIYIKI